MKILAIGHEASRTGAPKSLLYITGYAVSKGHTVVYLILNGGPMEIEYRENGKVFLINKKYSNNIFRRIINRITGKYKVKSKIARKIIQSYKPDIIFANTILSGEVLNDISEYIKVPVVGRMPELPSVIKYFNSKNACADHFFTHCDHIIAVSQAVANELKLNFKSFKGAISVVNGGIKIRSDNNVAPEKNNYFPGSDNFIVIGCGTLIYRKGYDLFIKTAKEVLSEKNTENIRFLWIGGDVNSLAYTEIQREITLLNLQNNVFITGEVHDPYSYFLNSDCFLLTSREDPFPLVMLEAANAGLPLICFDKSGGAPEFVSEDIGFVVDYADTFMMAEKIIKLYNDKQLCDKMGIAAKQRLNEYSIENKAEQILNILENPLIEH